jgi:hypothetical protein
MAEDKTAIANSKAKLAEELKNDAEKQALRLSRVNDVSVVGVMRAKGIAGKATSNSMGRIVGYKIKNESDKPVAIHSMKYTGEGPGKYVGTPEEIELAPGQELAVSKRTIGASFVAPEFGSYLANGKINFNSKKENATAEELLAAAEFVFKKDSGKTLTDTDLTIFVDIPEDNKFVLKPEFVETFGFLANTSATNEVKSGVSDKEAMAFYIYTKAKEQGLIPSEL